MDSLAETREPGNHAIPCLNEQEIMLKLDGRLGVIFRKTLWILSIVLLAQILLIAWSMVDTSSDGVEEIPLLGLDRSAIKQIVIEKNNQPALKIENSNGRWVLPEMNQRLANTSKVDALLVRLLSIKSSWPVAQTKTATEHFRVAEDNYLARIKLILNEQKTVILLLGLSPGAKSTYVRVADSDDIYLIPFNVLDLSVHSNNWLDKQQHKEDENPVELSN